MSFCQSLMNIVLSTIWVPLIAVSLKVKDVLGWERRICFHEYLLSFKKCKVLIWSQLRWEKLFGVLKIVLLKKLLHDLHLFSKLEKQSLECCLGLLVAEFMGG